mgnify:CR=1 FL=1
MKRYKQLLAAVLALVTVFSLSACGGSKSNETTPSGDDSQEDLQTITFVLDWTPNTNHTGLYVAQKNGYFADNGLEITIEQPPEDGAEALVASGKAQFGVSFQENVASALTADSPLPITAVAALIQHNTSGFVTAADKNITSPKDFEGKTYAGWGGPGEAAVLEAVMTQAGADFSKLNMVVSDGSGFAALENQADIMWFFEGWDNITCEMNHFPINYMPVRELDDRLDYYTPVIIAGNDTLEQRPEMVKKFLKATEKGYQYAISHPEESAENPPQVTRLTTPWKCSQKSQEFLAGKYMEDTDVWGNDDR